MTDPEHEGEPRRSLPRTIARVLLGVALLLAGVGHLTFARQEFQAQVPSFLPLDPDLVVLASGVVEVALGAALLVVRRHRVWVGLIVAAFFVAVFPGNIAQWLEGRDGFGLDSDGARFGRLFFQPLLVAMALWSTGAWDALRRWRRDRSRGA
ncbi:DoxX family membrane protein [Agrococcus sp. 1P02AA]|uniref:DoxX family protein n=1 Tax=Agrococcus sp. 1P02AA TaxID=3132259 RepID=UPI0039A6D55D